MRATAPDRYTPTPAVCAAHGTRARYRARCRCTPCKAANAAHVFAWRAKTTVLVPAEATIQHLFRLRASGIGSRQAAKLAGVSRQTVLDIRNGRRAMLERDVAARILAVRPIPAPGQSVVGFRTRKLLDSVFREGYQKQDVARRFRLRSPLRAHLRKRVRVRTAAKALALFRFVTADGLPERAEASPS